MAPVQKKVGSQRRAFKTTAIRGRKAPRYPYRDRTANTVAETTAEVMGEQEGIQDDPGAVGLKGQEIEADEDIAVEEVEENQTEFEAKAKDNITQLLPTREQTQAKRSKTDFSDQFPYNGPVPEYAETVISQYSRNGTDNADQGSGARLSGGDGYDTDLTSVDGQESPRPPIHTINIREIRLHPEWEPKPFVPQIPSIENINGTMVHRDEFANKFPLFTRNRPYNYEALYSHRSILRLPDGL